MKIAIDGPSASGKSSVAKKISEILNYPYLETGLVYRAFAFLSIKKKIKPENFEKLFKENIKVIPEIGKTVVKIDKESVDENFLKTEEVGKRASELGAIPEFRERINEFFRKIIGNRQIVVEGRDAGTHIIPNADLKFFITASAEERARRRYLQLKELGFNVSYEEVLKQIIERDKRDRERPKYPFKPAEDAIIIDTTNKSLEEVIDEILSFIKKSPEFSKSS